MMLKIPKRRRYEGKTDYKARIYLLKSGMPRIVIRKSNKYITIQLVESKTAKDNVIEGISSKELLEKGWPKEMAGSLHSLPAAYITGYLFGKSIKAKVKEAITDLGLYRSVAGSRIYAAIKGIIDAGVEVKCGEKMIPSQERLMGKHMKKDMEKIIAEIKNKNK